MVWRLTPAARASSAAAMPRRLRSSESRLSTRDAGVFCLLRVTSSFIHYHSRVAVFLLACAQTAWALAGRAELFGTVRDPAGLALPGATAELSEANTGLRHAALTGDRGEYHFAALLPGAYSVTVGKAGFRTLQRTGIERFTIGNASRNPVRGPGYPAADL